MNTQRILYNLSAFSSRMSSFLFHEQHLHNDRFASSDDLKPIASTSLNETSLLLLLCHKTA
jgi:hypothetical protein